MPRSTHPWCSEITSHENTSQVLCIAATLVEALVLLAVGTVYLAHNLNPNPNPVKSTFASQKDDITLDFMTHDHCPDPDPSS